MKKEYYNLPQWKEFKQTGNPKTYCEFCHKREKLIKDEELGKGM
jgi:hypothetical protein